MLNNTPLIELGLNEINDQLLSIRYQDSVGVCETEMKGKEDQKFQHLCKSMLVRYGSVHAAILPIKRGLWNDPYHRENVYGNNSLLDYFFKEINNQLIKKGIYLNDKYIPVNNIQTLKEAMGSSFSTVFEQKGITLHVAGKKVALVEVKEPYATNSKAKKIISNMGQFPNRDLQLWVVATNYKNLYEERIFSEIKNTEKYYTPSKDLAVNIQRRIIQLLSEEKDHSKQIARITLFKNLIEKISLNKDTRETKEQIRLAFSRLEYILQHAISSPKEKCDFFLEFAFDELIFINTLLKRNSNPEIIENLTQFIKTQHMINWKEAKDIETFVCLGNCCMDSLTQNINSAIKQIKTHKNTVKLYYSREVYFEINRNLQRFTNDDPTDIRDQWEVPQKVCLTLNEGGSGEFAEYKADEICDIVVCDFFSSVSRLRNRHKETPIEDIIEYQFTLRKKNRSDNKLIVIIDTTNNSFDDGYVMLLLEKFKQQLNAGDLAIITSQSLNKYFHMGFDKLPGGITAAFYNPNIFAGLAEFHQKNVLMNHQATDPTPQMIATLLKVENYTDNILDYHHSIKKNSRYIHHKIKPINFPDSAEIEICEFEPLSEMDPGDVSDIEDIEVSDDEDTDSKDVDAESQKKEIKPTPNHKLSDKAFLIYNPYAGLFQNWGFLVIASNNYILNNRLTELLNVLGIECRGGYGYLNSTYTDIPKNITRISIGAEATRNFKNKFKVVINFVNSVNEIYCAHKNISDFMLKYCLQQSIEEYNNLVNQKEKEEAIFDSETGEIISGTDSITEPRPPDSKDSENNIRKPSFKNLFRFLTTNPDRINNDSSKNKLSKDL